MTGTSKALKRLGVAGLSVVVMSVGLQSLTEIAANAAQGPYPVTNATSVSLSPDTDTAATGECNPFTATVNAGASFSVNIQEAVPSGTAIGAEVIGFCDPLATNADDAGGTYITATQQGPGTAGANTNDNSTGTATAGTCSNTVAPVSPATSNVSCDTTFLDRNSDGKVVFGVTSTTAGSMSVNAFADLAPANGAQDVNEPGDTSTKTWVANNTTGTPANSNTVSCTPTSQSNPTGGTANFTCTVKDSGGNALAGQTVHFGVASGPQAGNPANATCGPTASGAAGTTPGQTPTCSYNNTTNQPGHDVINAWLETNGTPGQQTGEPSTTITADWVTAAANGSKVTVTCSPNQTVQTGTAPNQSSVCQLPLNTSDATLTATVVNGTPSQPQAGVLVQWSITSNVPPVGDTDTETITPASCTTASNGQCTTTLHNPTPTEGESIRVQASVPTQGVGGPSVATAIVNWHNPAVGEARNITVTPATSSQQAGGVQTFTAKVVDRFKNPVKGFAVNWSETGPGSFRGGANTAQCVTDATGSCSVDVTSLVTESGDETVTASIAQGANPGVTDECSSPAGFSDYTPGGLGSPGTAVNTAGTAPNTTGGQNNLAPGAVAGNCTASGKATWTAGSPTGAASVTVTAPAGKVGRVETAAATVKDSTGKAVANQVVNFTVSGSNNATGNATTNASGVATFSYTPRNAGADKITAIVNNGTTNPSGSTTATISPSSKRTIVTHILFCKSPTKHALRCKVQVSPAVAGLQVTLRSSSGKFLGSQRTNAKGLVVINHAPLKSGSKIRVHARVAGSATTKPATSNTVTVRIR